MFNKLPPELMSMVLDNMTSISDLKNLCEISKDIYRFIIPYLYKSVMLSASTPWEYDIDSVVAKIKHTHLAYTKEIGLWGPYHGEPSNGCCPFHHSLAFQSGETGNPEQEATPFQPFSQLMDNFDRAVSAIPRNQLQSFKWDLGTCLPDELVNRIEALLKNQKQINSIALITDSDCKVNRNTSSSIDLVQFSKLESLSWKGLKHYNDFESVRAFISAHGAQLKTLCLDLIGWDSAVLAWRRGFLRNSPQDTGLPDNFFARSVLCLQHGKLIRPFPALKCLTLTQVSFHPMQAEMVNALNVEGLRALQLSNCPGIFSWLRQVLRSGTPLNLKSLELVFNPELANQIIDEAFDNVTDTVTKFLQSFQGLEDLYLMLPQQTDWQAMSEGIAHHSSTLKRLVTHHLDRTEWLGSTDGDLLLKTAELQSPIRSTSLQFYGVSVSTQKLATHQDTFNDCVILSPNVKLLHLRASGSEMSEQTHNEPLLTSQAMKTLYRFAHWAFSSEGSPNLQVLAYGDFSHNNHFSNYNVILCRSGDGYRELDCPDGIYWDLVQDNKDMLAACSCDELIVGRGMPDFT